MPRIRLAPAVLIIGLGLTGCATTNPGSGGEHAYLESAADIRNYAPESMSLPPQTGASVLMDPVYMRTQADYHFALAEAFSLEGNPQKAVEEFKLTLVYDPTSALIRLRLAAEYIKQGLVSEALDQAKLSVEMDPSYEDGHLLLGGLYSALRMYGEAIVEYRKVLELNPENTEAPMFIGALLAEQKKYAEAVKYFKSLAENPRNKSPHVAWYYIGRVHLEESKNGQTEKAEAAFRKCLELKPTFADAIMALGQIYETSGRRTEAIRHYSAFQGRHGPDATVAESLGRLYLEDEEMEKAYRQFEVIEAADAENLNVKVKMAFIMIEQKRYSEAILKLEDVLARAPYSDKIRFYLGAVYEEIKDYKSAIVHFQKIPVGSSYFSEAVIHAAYLYKLLGDYDNAVAVIQDGIKNQEDQPQFYALFASFLDDLREYQKAVDMLDAAVAKFPQHAQLRFFLGSMHDRVGNVERTIQSMEKVLEIDSDHVQALNYLAYTFAEQNRDLDAAESFVRRALELQPNDGYILDTFGWVLYKKGKTAEAVRALEAAYKIQPSESIIAEHLGDAYYKHELPEKAKKMYQRAAEIETDAKNLQKLRAKIVAIEEQMQTVGPAEPARQPASASAGN